jgi:tetratricopeptide (TPR) repeat protein
MKNCSFLYFLSFILFIACKDNSSSTYQPPAPVPEIDSMVQRGLQVYGTDPRQAVTIFIEAGKAYEQVKHFDKAGGVFLNVAAVFEENLANVDSAEYYALRSLNNYKQGIDSMQIMNTMKYYGFLAGANGKLAVGREHINEAIAFYTRRNQPDGLATAQFNLARLAFAEKNYDESQRLLTAAKSYWKQKGDALRLGLIQMQEIEIAVAKGDFMGIQRLVGSTDSLAFTNKLPDGFILRYNNLKKRIQ